MTENRVSSYESERGAGLTLKVLGDLDLNIVKEFRQAYEDRERHYRRYTVNLADCTRITNAGLGMLLLLHDFAQVRKEDLLIVNGSPTIHSALNFSGFSEVFTIQ